MNNNYDLGFLTEEEFVDLFLGNFNENTITIDEEYNIADQLANEKKIDKYIRSFRSYNN